MNLKEYISSGILESYVLGDLSVSERSEVEKNLALYPELKRELELIEETQERLLMAQAIRPRAEVKETVFGAIDKLSSKTQVLDGSQSRQIGFWRLAAAASISIAVIASVLAYNYYRKWNETASELAVLTAQNQRIAEEYNEVNHRLDKLSEDVGIMSNPSFKRVTLKGTPSAPEALASVYWNESTSELYLQIQEMKELSQENQYQLWAIIEGKPVDAGVFDPMSGLIRMRDVQKGATNFAVTIEPRGGNASPSLETMQVIGAVEKS